MEKNVVIVWYLYSIERTLLFLNLNTHYKFIELKVKGHLSSVLQIAGELLVINNKAFFTIEPNIVLGA